MPSPYQIQIANQQASIPVNEAELMRFADATLHAERVAQAEISLAVVDDATIHEINRQHLQHDYPTDVISFLLNSHLVDPRAAAPGQTPRRGTGLSIDGEIILSADTAAREAGDYGWVPLDEMGLYVVHGLLHLCGYDDLTDEEQAVMRQREREILASLGLTARYEDD